MAEVALGVLQSATVSLFGGGWQNVVVHLVFFLALAIRPQGLFRKGAIARSAAPMSGLAPSTVA